VLSAIREGKDGKALGALYKNLLPKIRAYVKANNGSDDEAFDVFQDAVVIFFKQVMTDKFDEKYKVSAFIYSVCRNLWINRAKKINKHVDVDNSLNQIHSDDFVDEIYNREKRQIVKDLFEKLDVKCRELLTLSVYQNLSMEDIKNRLGFASENAAKTSNYRCKKKLTQLIKSSALYHEIEF
jgi:RNA polymerase sigma factor (sigma-70 family)